MFSRGRNAVSRVHCASPHMPPAPVRCRRATRYSYMDTLEKTTFPTTEPSSSAQYWAEELDPRHARFRAKIGGLHCSLCTGTLEKALGRLPGVEKVAVSLTHEQARVEYDATVIRAD